MVVPASEVWGNAVPKYISVHGMREPNCGVVEPSRLSIAIWRLVCENNAKNKETSARRC